MLRSLTLKNFRCFQNFTIEPLERINLIGGKNNVGKTSLLEAIFIFINPNNPESLLQINRLRGIGKSGRFEDMEEMRGFFFGQEMIDNIIKLSGIENNQIERFLEIYLNESKKQLSLFEDFEDLQSNASLTTEFKPHNTLVLEYQINKKSASRISLTADGKLIGTRSRKEKFPLGIYLTTNIRSSKEDTVRFSNLERVGQQEAVLQTLRLLEPRLKRLTVLVDSEAIIYGDIGVSQLVPLPLMGEGIGRLLSIVLAIANAKGGTVLIDEIENGLHHSVLTNVWKAIADAARRADVQIFATTHSRECIIAAHEAFKNSDKYDFRYHRLDRVKDEIKAITYDQEALETSEELDWEIR
ncbi:putative ATPase [Cylindrospermum stagnale PCC 7417]|uniref:Putative ATPase n=1 Tax=Cylindrospermum stagnale PCC 7417 TaxID=56107 RepID=K9WU56_9NOST|nr:AAA family ATPase [Cylindrospermum stagnale]AFZ23733.1 putative ATPase [Cylindrospermum stagnale PCC 7417]